MRCHLVVVGTSIENKFGSIVGCEFVPFPTGLVRRKRNFNSSQTDKLVLINCKRERSGEGRGWEVK